jgi:hypothetical protein
MTSIAVGAARELFEDKVIDLVKEKLRKVFRRRLITAAGQRAAGLLGGLAVPEPVVSKIIAIGFGIWTAWVIIEILYEYFAMAELFEEVLQKMWDKVLLPMLSGPEPPNRDRLTRILECMAGCWGDAMAQVGLLTQAFGGKTLDQIKTEAFDCMVDCLRTP